MRRCYSFVTNRSLSLGYDEPRRLHLEEMKALFTSRAAQRKSTQGGNSVRMQLGSIASWIEAQESLSAWLAFNQWRDFWKATDTDEADEVAQAFMLAQLPQNPVPTEFRSAT